MATETKTQREAAGNKAAATRKRNTAKRSATRAKASATQTRSAARSTARAARSTATEANRRADAATSSFEALVRQAERAMVLIPVGAALEARDAAVNTVRTYTQPRSARLEFNRFERRGEKALKRR
jgi:hypothetical protein